MKDDGLSPERATRIADAIEDIERNVAGLEQYQSLTRAEYCSSEALEKRDAVERKFEKLIAATVDSAETAFQFDGIGWVGVIANGEWQLGLE